MALIIKDVCSYPSLCLINGYKGKVLMKINRGPKKQNFKQQSGNYF